MYDESGHAPGFKLAVFHKYNKKTRNFFQVHKIIIKCNLSVRIFFLALTFFSLATMKTWKLVSLFVAIPACLLCTYNAVLKEKEHHSHPRAEFLPYVHLRIRKKVGDDKISYLSS